MLVFEKLRALRDFEKRNLPFLTSIEDFDLLLEIGCRQEKGGPLTPKQLYLLGIGSTATIQRRLARLKRLGVVQCRRSRQDARSVELRISAKVWKTFKQYAALLCREERASQS